MITKSHDKSCDMYNIILINLILRHDDSTTSMIARAASFSEKFGRNRVLGIDR